MSFKLVGARGVDLLRFLTPCHQGHKGAPVGCVFEGVCAAQLSPIALCHLPLAGGLLPVPHRNLLVLPLAVTGRRPGVVPW